MKRFEEFVAAHFNKVIVYLIVAGALMFQDFLEGHHSYGLCVFCLAILDNIDGE